VQAGYQLLPLVLASPFPSSLSFSLSFFVFRSEYAYGTTVQYWGTTPACDMSCVDPRTQELACCTSPCAVTGVQSASSPAQFSSLVSGDPSQGVRVTLFGETPTKSDPFRCDYDPVSGAPYPRVTHQEFYCDPSVTGFAELYQVIQNQTDTCDYTLRFKTSAACINSNSLSGGWVFSIIVMVTSAVYFGVGSVWVKRSTGSWGIPNKAFWAALDELILEGCRFILRGCKKNPNAGEIDKVTAFDQNGAALSSPGLKGSPFVGSSYNASSGSSSSSGSGDSSIKVISNASPKTPRSGYQAIGTPGNDSDL
jgi:Autophagy-related protein 27